MAKTIDELKSAAAVVRDATEEHENTALRIGQLLLDTIETLGDVQANAIKGYVAIASTDDLPESPTAEQQQKGWLLGTVLYVWVGTGGDTLGGKYQSAQLKGADGAPGEKGDKGDSGVHLGDVALVNDLTTGGEESALTAEMGKLLGESMTANRVVNGGETFVEKKNDDIPTDGLVTALRSIYGTEQDGLWTNSVDSTSAYSPTMTRGTFERGVCSEPLLTFTAQEFNDLWGGNEFTFVLRFSRVGRTGYTTIIAGGKIEGSSNSYPYIYYSNPENEIGCSLLNIGGNFNNVLLTEDNDQKMTYVVRKGIGYADIFFNGVLHQHKTYSTGNVPPTIGSDCSMNLGRFDVYDILYYSRALTDNEIIDLSTY